MPERPDDFTALLARLRAGDETAFAALAEQYAPVVRRAARGLLGPSLRPCLDSVDVLQSVHRSLLIGLRHQKFAFTTPEELTALALTMVRRKVARHWRRLQRRAGPSGQVTPQDIDTAELRETLPGAEPDPAQAAEASDTVAHFLSQLPELDRRLLELRLEGCSTADAARLLGVDAGVLRVRLGRLRQHLRERGLLSEWL